MHDNNLYNLMRQIVEEHTNLLRIKNEYIKDSDCDDCRSFWQKMDKDKEDHVKDLTGLIKQHLS